MNQSMSEWKHIFKLDPAKQITMHEVEQLCASGTDAIIIGGTDNITYENVLHLQSMLRSFRIPCILEVSSMDAITPGFDYYFIPMVLNSKDKKWMMDIHHEAIKAFGSFMDWDSIFMEGYCILNESSKAYQKSNCKQIDKDDVLAYARMAEHVFHLPIFYIEYSGVYGDPAIVSEAKDLLQETLLFYGGGIETPEQAREMKEHSDVIIVGNSIYTNFTSALATVQAVKDIN